MCTFTQHTYWCQIWLEFERVTPTGWRPTQPERRDPFLPFLLCVLEVTISTQDSHIPPYFLILTPKSPGITQ